MLEIHGKSIPGDELVDEHIDHPCGVPVVEWCILVLMQFDMRFVLQLPVHFMRGMCPA